MNDRERNQVCDVLIVGSGAGGLSTAITAKKGGLDVVIIEKEAFFGGTTAYSGGVLWIPGNPHARKAGINDTREAAVTYLRNETGNYFSEKAIEAFLDQGPRMLEFFERETEAKFLLSGYPDYHPDVEGGALIGRSVTAAQRFVRRVPGPLPRRDRSSRPRSSGLPCGPHRQTGRRRWPRRARRPTPRPHRR